ncbi:hypothetical protein FRC00_000124 [Tulasnella sp. 408]|nr:hypothetical protein FRC00_000124 [Tulasnella sp. 408]
MPVFRATYKQQLYRTVFPEDTQYLRDLNLRHKQEFEEAVEEAEVRYLLFTSIEHTPEPITPSPSPSPRSSPDPWLPSPSPKPKTQTARRRIPVYSQIQSRIKEATRQKFYYFLDVTDISPRGQEYLHDILPSSSFDQQGGLYIPYEPTKAQFALIEKFLKGTYASDASLTIMATPAPDFANMNNDALRTTLADMWNRLETANQAYQALDNSHTTLLSQHAALQTQVQAAALQPQIHVPTPQIHVSQPSTVTPKAPKVPKPEPFKGDRGPPARVFIQACEMYFLVRPDDFADEPARIRFTLMLLQEKAS